MLSIMLAAAGAASAPPLAKQLEPLSFLVGNCWRGEFKARGHNDTHCFEGLYDGAHVRDRHEVRDSGGKVIYAGETLYSWNGKTGQLEYTYVSSDGAVSHGSVRETASGLDFGDETYNGTDGKELKISTLWRKTDDGYDAVNRSSVDVTGEQVVAFKRVK